MARGIRELVNSCATVASLPSIYQRLSEVMNDPYTSAADFGAIVSEDPGLTARLLQLVNSAFYGLPARMDSVTQALSVVGTNQLHDLALATSVITAFKDIPSDLVDMESFWRHSMGCGVTARALAAQRRAPNVERIFVAGLLHDIGHLVIYLGNPDGARGALEKAASGHVRLVAAEREVMGYDHAAVGRALLAAWGLPEALQEPVGYHHEPRRATLFPADTAIVHVSDIVAHALMFGRSGESFVPSLCPTAWSRLDNNETISRAIINDVDRQYAAAVQAILQPAAA